MYVFVCVCPRCVDHDNQISTSLNYSARRMRKETFVFLCLHVIRWNLVQLQKAGPTVGRFVFREMPSQREFPYYRTAVGPIWHAPVWPPTVQHQFSRIAPRSRARQRQQLAAAAAVTHEINKLRHSCCRWSTATALRQWRPKHTRSFIQRDCEIARSRRNGSRYKDKKTWSRIRRQRLRAYM